MDEGGSLLPRTTSRDRGGASAVIALRDPGLLAAIHRAVSASAISVVDVSATPRELLAATSSRRPDVVVATLDVLGAAPEEIVRQLVVRDPDVRIIVLSPFDTLPWWLVEAGAYSVVPQDGITELKQALARALMW